MVWMLMAAAFAGPVAPAVSWATDSTGQRTVIHQPDGSLALWRVDGTRLGVLPGPKDVSALVWKGNTLVGTGSTGTWVWDTATGALLYKFAALGEPMLSEDGRVLDLGPWTVVVGEPVPEGLAGR
jgi:hypothetical protein